MSEILGAETGSLDGASVPAPPSNAGLYEPLPSPTSIRLIGLVMEPDSKIIECNLIVCELDTAPDFAALSYTWGAPTPTFPISVNSCPDVQVTGNLHGALLRLRRRPKFLIRSSPSTTPDARPDPYGPECYFDDGECEMVRLLWIDSLCINQADEGEKAQQVVLMGKIYAQAARVITWLPKCDFVGEELLKMMMWASTTQMRLQRSPTLQFNESDLPEWGSDIWEKFLTIFKNPYFERVWVIQEVALAKFAVVFIGDHEIDWLMLGSAAMFFELRKEYWQKPLPLAPFNLDTNPFTQANKIWSLYCTEDPSRSLLKLLKDFRNREATKGADKVFSMLGLCTTYPVTVDYTRTDQEVFSHVARVLMQQDRNLNVLSAVPWTQFHYGPLGAGSHPHDTYQKNDRDGSVFLFRTLTDTDDFDTTPPYSEIENFSGGPPSSWAPYWNVNDFGPEIQPLLHHGTPYDASAGTPSKFPQGTYEPLLELEGLSYDTIDICSPVIGDAAGFYVAPDMAGDLVRAKKLFDEDFEENAALEGTLEDRKWSFATAMVAGTDFRHGAVEASPSFQEEARAYWESILGEQFLNPVSASTDQNPDLSLDDREIEPLASTNTSTSQVLPKNEGVQTGKVHAMVVGQNSYYFPAESGTTCKQCIVARNYCARILSITYRRRIFRTKGGRFGLASSNVIPGDQVVVLFGGRAPFVVRKKKGHYRLISDAYVHRIMYGELVRKWQNGEVSSEVFPIL